VNKTIRTKSNEEHAILAAELSRLRVKAGLSIRELGRRIDHHHNYVYRVENGRGYVDFASMRAWIEATGNDFVEVMANVDAECKKLKDLKKNS
jgi:transcriptional regulator with XRE-family HTH domain